MKVNVRDWLIDLAEHNYVDWLHGEIAILPVKEEDDDN